MKSEPIEVFLVPEVEKGLRLSDYAVGKFESLPTRKSVKKAIKRFELLVNGEPSTTGYWVRKGDTLSVVHPHSSLPLYERTLKVVFEDEHLAAIVKPADIEVSGRSLRTVQNALRFNLTPSAQIDALHEPRPVHRLDRQTGGIMLVAKTRTAAANLGEEFENRKVVKTYLALVKGEITSPIVIQSDIDDKEAVTEIKPVATWDRPAFGKITAVHAHPLTGRRNQIRIHLSNEGFPILGDLKFGGEGTGRGLFLFAVSIRFSHPGTREEILISAPIPRKFGRMGYVEP